MELKRPNIAILGDRIYLQDITRYLSPFYSVVQYSVKDKIPVSIYFSPPDLIIVDEAVGLGGAFVLVSKMKEAKAFKNIPIFISFNIELSFISKSEESRLMANTKKAGAIDYLLGPVGPLTLEKITNFFTNTDNTANRFKLPVDQAFILKKTVDSFKNIFTTFQQNSLLNYCDIQSACLPIISVIADKQYDKILDALKEHDGTTFAHSTKVAALLSLFGSSVGLTDRDEQMALCSGGVLHDIGKCKIKATLLNKKEKLTDKEQFHMHQHVEFGLDILVKSHGDIPLTTLTITAQHHEKVDGTGYPNKIQSKAFHPLGRMTAIVDSFAALTDSRAYRPAVSKEVALRQMMESEGHFDYHLLKEFRDVIYALK